MNDNVKFIHKINARIRNIKIMIAELTGEMDYLNSLINDIGELNGIAITKSGYLSTKSLIGEKVQAAIEAKIPVPKTFVETAKQYVLDAYSDEENAPDVSKMSAGQILNAAGKIALLYSTYADALKDFYMYDKDVENALTQMDGELKEELEKLLHDIDMSIHHPGVWSLPVETVEENKKMIGEFVAKAKALKEGSIS